MPAAEGFEAFYRATFRRLVGQPPVHDRPGKVLTAAAISYACTGVQVPDNVSNTCRPLQDWRAHPSRFTAGLDEPVENRLFAFTGTAPKRAVAVRFQVGDQQPFMAQRVVDLGPELPGSFYVAVFSPAGGTTTMARAAVSIQVLDAVGHTICTTTYGSPFGGCP